MLVVVLEVADEILRVVLDDGDILWANSELADSLLDDFRFHLLSFLPQPGHHAVHEETVELVVLSGEGHRCSFLGAVGRVTRHCHSMLGV